MTTPIVVGVSVAFGALAARQALLALSRTAGSPRMRKFYEGGFQSQMTKREAALILGVRER